MGEPLKIKLTIAGRVYPLTIAPEQEQSLRQAAKKIDATIQKLEQNYAVRDKQDVLAMCTLQFAAQLEAQKEAPSDDHAAIEKLKDLIDLIDVHVVTY